MSWPHKGPVWYRRVAIFQTIRRYAHVSNLEGRSAMQPPNTLPPAGWYPDPNGEMRWWDGTRWGAAAQTSQVVDQAKRNNRKALLLAGALGGVFVLLAVAVAAAGGTKHSAAPVKALEVTTTTTAPPAPTTTAAPAPAPTPVPTTAAPPPVPAAPVATTPKSVPVPDRELAFRILMLSHGLDPSSAVKAGHAVCTALDAGNSVPDVAAAALLVLGVDAAQSIGVVLGGGVAAFCPQYQSAIDSFANSAG